MRSLLARLSGGRRGLLTLAILLPFITPLYAPQLLAFPYRTTTPIGTVWSDQRLEPAMLDRAVSVTRTRLATTPLAGKVEARPIFVTDGGWRWLWLTTANQGAFAISRPLTKAIVLNATDPATGVISNGRSLGNKRSLGTVLAHEFTHGLIRRRYGELRAAMFPQWKVEGYCDHVAGESSLTAAEVTTLEARHIDHPALPYFHGRQRVETELTANGNSVDDLFASKD